LEPGAADINFKASVREEGSCISGLTERLFWRRVQLPKVTEASKIGPTACVVSLDESLVG